MANDDKVTVKDIYADENENIRFAKRQMLQTVNYIMLAYVALVGLYQVGIVHTEMDVKFWKTAVSLIGLVIMIYGVIALGSYQTWRWKSGLRLDTIFDNEYATDEFLKVRETPQPWIHEHFMAWIVPWLLFSVVIGGYVALFVIFVVA